MATQVIHLKRQHFPSLQVGDFVYKSGTTSVEGGFNVSSTSGIQQLGSVTAITDGSIVDGATDPLNPVTTLTKAITVDVSSTVTLTNTDYLFFSKDNTVNRSSVVGYYGSANFKNSSSSRAELYSVSCEISESSK
jgi:hypothetical protein